MQFFNNNYDPNRYTGVWLGGRDSRFGVSFGDGGGTNPAGRRTAVADFAFEPDELYHVAAVLKSAGDATLYVDGQELCGVSYTGTGGPLTYNSNDGNIGLNPNGTQFSFGGDMDEIALYARALNAGEILTLGGLWGRL